MYNGLLHAHSGFRWLVLIALVVAIVISLAGWIKRSEWTKSGKISGLVLTILMDIQFLIGLVLYLFLSPMTKAAFNDFGAAMKNDTLRFYVVEHILIMVIALALVHIGKSRTKKDLPGWKKHRSSFIFYGISLLVILMAIPWDRAMF
ncbi:cytochrome B [Maribellus sediminis]|uniref:cytochrome B n=1 Tax=Maribellus sediminis TaxID=2696285 RepID=UPI0014313640|nr:cytochrome B [Maribellus sediminis]